MSHAQLTKTIPSDLNSETLKQKLISFLEEKKFKISTNQENLIVANQGSQLISRLIGFWLSPVGFLPKMITVELNKSDSKLELQIIMEDTIGFGIVDPISKNKYKKYFESVLADLEKALA